MLQAPLSRLRHRRLLLLHLSIAADCFNHLCFKCLFVATEFKISITAVHHHYSASVLDLHQH